MATLQLKVEDDIKLQATKLFHKLGITTTSAVNMFLHQAVMNNGLPFAVKINDNYNQTTLYAMDDVLDNKNISKGYKSAKVMLSDMLGD